MEKSTQQHRITCLEGHPTRSLHKTLPQGSVSHGSLFHSRENVVLLQTFPSDVILGDAANLSRLQGDCQSSQHIEANFITPSPGIEIIPFFPPSRCSDTWDVSSHHTRGPRRRSIPRKQCLDVSHQSETGRACGAMGGRPEIISCPRRAIALPPEHKTQIAGSLCWCTLDCQAAWSLLLLFGSLAWGETGARQQIRTCRWRVTPGRGLSATGVHTYTSSQTQVTTCKASAWGPCASRLV